MYKIGQKSCVDFNSTSFFKSEGFNVYCLVVSGIACSCLNFLPVAALLLALRQDNLHGLVNCGSLLWQPKRTFHYGQWINQTICPYILLIL